MDMTISLNVSLLSSGFGADLREDPFDRPCDCIIALLFFRDIYECHIDMPHAVGDETPLVEPERLAGATFDEIAAYGAFAVTLAHRHQHADRRTILSLGDAAIGHSIGTACGRAGAPVYQIDASERKRKERTATGKQRIYVAFEAYSFYFRESVVHTISP